MWISLTAKGECLFEIIWRLIIYLFPFFLSFTCPRELHKQRIRCKSASLRSGFSPPSQNITKGIHGKSIRQLVIYQTCPKSFLETCWPSKVLPGSSIKLQPTCRTQLVLASSSSSSVVVVVVVSPTATSNRLKPSEQEKEREAQWNWCNQLQLSTTTSKVDCANQPLGKLDKQIYKRKYTSHSFSWLTIIRDQSTQRSWFRYNSL